MAKKTIKIDSPEFFNQVDKARVNERLTGTDYDSFVLKEKKQETCYDDDGNTINFVVQRVSDGLFFAGEYEKWPGSHEVEMLDEELEQVFAVPKTVIVYE